MQFSANFSHMSRRCHDPFVLERLVHRQSGPSGPWLWPVNAAVCRLQDGKARAGNALPVVVVWDVMSYRTSRRWRMRLYVATYVIIRRYKSGCALVLGSLFISPVAGVLKYPTSQLSHHELSPGLYQAPL